MVRPAEEVHMSIDISLPGPGHSSVSFDLVAEGVAWFENLGSTPVYVTVQTS